MDNSNKKTFEAQVVIGYYVNAKNELQDSERAIFNKYREKLTGAKILDIGCGAGRFTELLHELAEEYLGIDYSLEMIKSCKQQYPNIAFQHCDVRDMSIIKNEYFDVVIFSFNGLDYVDHKGRVLALTEIRRVMKNGGVFIFSSHNLSAFQPQSPRMRFDFNPYRQFHHFIDYMHSWRNRLRNAKCEMIDDKYSILNDSGHQFALMTYYIRQDVQIGQLEQMGFHFKEMYNNAGTTISIKETDLKSPWIYYIVQK